MDLDVMTELVNKLNYYRNAYYNENQQIITDIKYDELFDQLKELENKSGIIFANSPTVTVGFAVQDKLNKVTHNHAMLSLDKSKDINDIIKFIDDKPTIATPKMDGLTCSLHYDESGDLVSAETRGNGIVGEDIFENAKQISNIPIHISKGPLTVDGEVIIDYDTFNKINAKLDNKYSHPRNLASGSLRQLDTKITKDRSLKFIPWKVVSGILSNEFNVRLTELKNFGFEVVPFELLIDNNRSKLEDAIDNLRLFAKINKYPIDGIVFSYNNIKYGESLGSTTHAPRGSFAFKFYDDRYETKLEDIEWQVSRTGMINPVAVFTPVDLDGAITTRATLHNLSIIKELELGIGDTITVFRANSVIPKVSDNLTRSNTVVIPKKCPCCGSDTEIKKDGIAEVLYCTNNNCNAKLLSKFIHFVSKTGVNIEGLSEATLDKFINLGLLHSYKDIYSLNKYYTELISLDGFGKVSIEKLFKSIENSRHIKLENFINSLGINQIGIASSKEISKYFNGSFDDFINAVNNKFDFTVLTDFGEVTNKAIYEFFNKDTLQVVKDLASEFTFEIIKAHINNNFINGMTFCITGALSKPRSYYEDLIIANGGKVTNSVSRKTNYLITNDRNSGSSKNKKAFEFGIPIIDENEFNLRCN